MSKAGIELLSAQSLLDLVGVVLMGCSLCGEALPSTRPCLLLVPLSLDAVPPGNAALLSLEAFAGVLIERDPTMEGLPAGLLLPLPTCGRPWARTSCLESSGPASPPEPRDRKSAVAHRVQLADICNNRIPPGATTANSLAIFPIASHLLHGIACCPP
ncbi:MAG: hypothetical protein IT348_19875 [Candidatus Eisenbacteria bacterium]|nr:hypothetical protein [Candidatus Eisenbacteria bacterium]